MTLCCSSCNGMKSAAMLSVLPTGLKKVACYENADSGKQVIMIAMKHLAKPAFYEEVRQYLDMLKDDGYVVFYEGVVALPPRFDIPYRTMSSDELKEYVTSYPLTRTDTMQLDTMLRKVRKVLGFHMGGNYKDADNKSLPDYYQNSNWIMQTKDNMGLTTDRDILVDMTYGEMIKTYETNYKKIVLDEYDFATPFNENYKTPDTNFHSSFHMTNIYRDEYISRRVLESDHNRIVLVYGSMHWYGIEPVLRDNGFQKTEIRKRDIKKLLKQHQAK